MQDTVKGTVKRNLIAAGILGILFPSVSLLYVRKEGLAVLIMALFLLSVLVLNYTNIAFFVTSFCIFILVQLFLWILSLILGIWFAWRGVTLQKLQQDKGLYWIIYTLLLLTFVSMLTNLPVSFFNVQEDFISINKSDLLVVQETGKQNFYQAQNIIIFLDEKYQKNFGEVLATPRDVLSSEDGHIYRNDILTDIQMKLPATDPTLTIPDDMKSINMSANSWLVPENTLLIRYPNTELALLPVERVRGKAIYVLFSKDFHQIGRSLTDLIIP